MAFSFYSNHGGQRTLLTDQLQNFWLYYDFSVAAANGMLQVNKGYFATFLADEGATAGVEPNWEAQDFILNAGAGVGTLTLAHALLRERILFESNTEFGKLHLFELDDSIAAFRAQWLDAAGWLATFAPPHFAQENRRMFHRLNVGAIDQRWVHWLASRSTHGPGAQSLTAVLPFVTPTLFSTVLQATTVNPEEASHMPRLTVETLHKQQTQVTKDWSHFHGDATALTGTVSGYVMIAQGAFQRIPLGDLADWHWAGPQSNATTVGKKLLPLVVSSVQLQGQERSLASFRALDQAANVPRDDENRPIEVLYLTGLASPDPVF